MAHLIGLFAMSHAPGLYRSAEQWVARRSERPIREDVPRESLEENQIKIDRVHNSLAVLREKLLATKPDVVLIFGDDQLECFNFNNFPPFAVYVGAEFEGYTTKRDVGPPGGAPPPRLPKQRVAGHPEFAIGLLTGLMKRSFDMSYCMDMPNPSRGVGHAFLNPADWLMGCSLPVVPVLFNCFYAPQPTGMRCYQLGKAVREVIDEFPGNLRVAIVGSGGLWHTPRAKGAYLDEEFDRQMLDRLKSGNARGMAEFFDAYRIPDDDTSQNISVRGPECTGMPALGGPQGGTRESTTWIAASATVEGRPWTVVDYIPVYSSPMGVGFAYCTVLN